VVCDIDANRLDEAKKAGAAAVVNLTDSDAEERLLRLGNGGFDIVVEASGSIPGITLAHKLLRRKPQNYSKDYKVEPIRFYGKDWPRLIVQANYIQKEEIDPFFFFKGEGVIVLTPFDRGVEDRQRVIEYIRSGKIDVSFFHRTICKPQAMPEHYRKLQKKEIISLVCDWR
jgi:threonine dehydrogenase-like Zn-dependent dehydrogenase